MTAIRTDEGPPPPRWRRPEDPRRRRAIISVLAFTLLAPALFAPVANVRAHAEGLAPCCIEREWNVDFLARIGAAGTYKSVAISESSGANVTPQAHAALDRFRRIHTPLLGNWWSLLFLVGALLSVRRRHGPLFGAATAVLGLVSTLSIVRGVETQIYSFGTSAPFAFDVVTTPALTPAVATWLLLLGCFSIRWRLDQRDEVSPGAIILGEEEPRPRRPFPSRGHGPALAGAALGTVILGGAVLLALLPFTEDCAALVRELGEEAPVGDCEFGNWWLLGFWSLWGAYGGAVIGAGLGLRVARQPLAFLTTFFSAILLMFTGYAALGMTLVISFPLGLVLFPAALVVGTAAARSLALRIAGPRDRDLIG